MSTDFSSELLRQTTSGRDGHADARVQPLSIACVDQAALQPRICLFVPGLQSAGAGLLAGIANGSDIVRTMVQPPNQLSPGNVALLGLPWDVMSSHMRGPADAPEAIRAALHGGSANLWSERGRDLGSAGLVDVGDLALPDDVGAFDAIATAVQRLVEVGAKPLLLGGDHAVTLGVLRAMAARHSPLTVLHVDAHPDLYDQLDGNRFSHACPFARAFEEGLVGRLVQVGIRTLNGHQREQARRFGAEIIPADAFDASQELGLEGPTYLSVDLDGLDPAFAPGVSHHEPGGLSTRDVLRLLDQLPSSFVGADVVELNPRRDMHGMTAMVAAKLVKEIACRLLDEYEPIERGSDEEGLA